MGLTDLECKALEVAEKVASSMARRGPRAGRAEPEDVLQEARMAALVATRTWDSNRDTEFGGYAWWAATRSVGRYLWRNAGPLSSETGNRRGCKPLVIAEGTDDGVAGGVVLESPQDGPDVAFETARLARQVREQVEFLLVRTLGRKTATIALRVLVREETPAEVHAATGVDVAKIYRMVQRAQSALETNALLYDLWRSTK